MRLKIRYLTCDHSQCSIVACADAKAAGRRPSDCPALFEWTEAATFPNEFPSCASCKLDVDGLAQFLSGAGVKDSPVQDKIGGKPEGK